MGTTATGLPFPDDTEFVTDGAAAIQALAQALEERIPVRVLAGVVVVPITNSASGTAPVAFPTDYFTGAPTVTLTVQQGGATYVPWVTAAPTAAGFNALVRHYQNTVGTGSVPVHWQAIEVLAGTVALADPDPVLPLSVAEPVTEEE